MAGVLTVTVCLCGLAHAQQSRNLVGEYLLTLENESADVMGLLVLERDNGEYRGFVENGPIDLTISGNSIEMRVDYRDPSGRQFFRNLTGQISANDNDEIVMSGTYTGNSSSGNIPQQSWQAGPYMSMDTSLLAPDPIDLSGVWGNGSGVDMRKYSMDTTPAAQAYTEAYDENLDQGVYRCMSPGIVQMHGYVYPVEIVHADDRIILTYEAFHQVREIYLDDREPPAYYPHSRLGFSKGHWEGNTLIINTTHIHSNTRDFSGEPLSDNATVVERYWIDEVGALRSYMEVHDPENYNRPPIRRLRREREDNIAVLFPYECDPESFYRQLYDEDRMEEYWSRSDMRL